MSTGEGTLVFDRYQIIRRLAAGGMGEIFLARQVVGLDRLVILKGLLPHLARDVEAVTRFLNEARVAATLNHPNIVSIYEVGSWNDVHYIVMEYIAGEHLGQVTAALARDKRAMPPHVALRIIRDTLTALDFAHHAKSADGKPVTVVHRDVSPQNVMIREDGVVKVVDFGIAVADSMAIRTRTGLVRGKLPYLSPELLQGAKANARSDQYAAGAVAWELLTGRRLFQGPRDGNMITSIIESEVPAPSTVQPGLSADVDKWVLTMLAKDVDKRYERCAAAARVAMNLAAAYSDPSDDSDVAAFIGTVISGSVAEKVRMLTPTTGAVIVHHPRTRTPERADPTVIYRPDKRRRMLMAVGAAVLAGLVSLLALLAGGDDAPEPPVTARQHSARLVLLSEPNGATVMEGETLLGTTPATIDSLPPSVTHKLRVLLLHHQPADITVQLNDGEERHIRVDLTPTSTLATNQATDPSPKPPQQRTPPAKPKDAPKSKTAKPATTGEDAQLTIRTKPWTRVSIDGQDRGITPLKIALEPGTHTLVFENPEAKLKQSKKIVLGSGQTQKLDLDLTK